MRSAPRAARSVPSRLSRSRRRRSAPRFRPTSHVEAAASTHLVAQPVQRRLVRAPVVAAAPPLDQPTHHHLGCLFILSGRVATRGTTMPSAPRTCWVVLTRPEASRTPSPLRSWVAVMMTLTRVPRACSGDQGWPEQVGDVVAVDLGLGEPQQRRSHQGESRDNPPNRSATSLSRPSESSTNSTARSAQTMACSLSSMISSGRPAASSPSSLSMTTSMPWA